MNVVTDEKRIEELLDRGIITTILPSRDEFKVRLMTGEPIRIYIGADPTSTALHLSHAKNYLLLEEFRKLGHEVIILIGDFTARIGDPSDRDSARIQLTEIQIQENVKTWLDQLRPLIDFETKDNPARLLYNNEWLGKLTWSQGLELASNFTVQQMLERDMFEKRMKEDKPIHLHEFMYPVMQGYDSVAMDVDAELCGTDQTFNALAGRTLLKRIKNKDKFVVVVNLLENPITKELMSKSKGTGVFLNAGPVEMFGAIMAQPDEMIEPFFINLTRVPLVEIKNILKQGKNKESKQQVAQKIVELFYGDIQADKAKQEFESVFFGGALPSDIPEHNVGPDGANIIDLLVDSGLASSRAEAKRLIDQDGVHKDDTTIITWGEIVKSGSVIKVGARRFVKAIE